MPELPEVETIRAGVAMDLNGLTISEVILNRADLRIPFPDGLGQSLNGQKLVETKRRAKYLILSFGNDENLVVHLGMSGRVMIIFPDDEYQPHKHDHMILKFETGHMFVLNDPRRFGMVFLLHNKDIGEHPSFKSLGPEPLSDDFSKEYFINALAYRKSPIKTALLDQRLVVGLGNIYVNEALYMCGIHPAAPCNKISTRDIKALRIAIIDVLRIAIDKGGSTLKDYKHTDGTMGYFQFHFAVYNKKRQACRNCTCNILNTGGVQHMMMGGRSTFFCPIKQKDIR